MSVTFQRQYAHKELVAQLAQLETVRLEGQAAYLTKMDSLGETVDESDLFFAGDDAEQELRDKWEDLSINLSNTNAYAFMQWLGYDVRMYDDPIWGIVERVGNIVDPYCGTFDPDELAGRCILAIELESDKDRGTETVAWKNDLGGTIIEGGRRSGYFTQHAKTMLEICRLAKQADQKISYA